MKIVIVGNGKLAKSLVTGLSKNSSYEIIHWNNYKPEIKDKVIIVHVGSGREINDCIHFCKDTESFLVDLSTSDETYEVEKFTSILCPNTALPILKTMVMLQKYGSMFDNEKIRIIESHQEAKKTIAGTAVEFSKYLNQSVSKIESIRDSEYQENVLGIPKEHLGLHAYHKIIIEETGCEIIIETKILGHIAYIAGVERIIDFIKNHNFEKRKYSINELILMGLK